jgi:catechol 2,3-dioxygenase-like lactoylglutathione lyase family enzyme
MEWGRNAVIAGIDHIVIAVRDLERAAVNFSKAGFTVTPGGEHSGGVTHNALIALADGSYFELIAWKRPPDTPDNGWWRCLQAGEGFIDYALRADDLDAEVARLRDAGLDVPDPVAGGRTRPDGQRVEWQ